MPALLAATSFDGGDAIQIAGAVPAGGCGLRDDRKARPGADLKVVRSALTRGRYPDCPRSQPPLAAEGNLNLKGAEEGLCPAQPASECAGALWPARPVGASQQEVGCASRPLRSVGHELAHVGGHRIGVEIFLIASRRLLE